MSQIVGVPDGLLRPSDCRALTSRGPIVVIFGDGLVDSVFLEVGGLMDKRMGFGTDTVGAELPETRTEIHRSRRCRSRDSSVTEWRPSRSKDTRTDVSDRLDITHYVVLSFFASAAIVGVR